MDTESTAFLYNIALDTYKSALRDTPAPTRRPSMAAAKAQSSLGSWGETGKVDTPPLEFVCSFLHSLGGQGAPQRAGATNSTDGQGWAPTCESIVETLETMRARKVKPDLFSYNIALSACVHAQRITAIPRLLQVCDSPLLDNGPRCRVCMSQRVVSCMPAGISMVAEPVFLLIGLRRK